MGGYSDDRFGLCGLQATRCLKQVTLGSRFTEMIGKRLLHYRILEALGHGGMGGVRAMRAGRIT